MSTSSPSVSPSGNFYLLNAYATAGGVCNLTLAPLDTSPTPTATRIIHVRVCSMGRSSALARILARVSTLPYVSIRPHTRAHQATHGLIVVDEKHIDDSTDTTSPALIRVAHVERRALPGRTAPLTVRTGSLFTTPDAPPLFDETRDVSLSALLTEADVDVVICENCPDVASGVRTTTPTARYPAGTRRISLLTDDLPASRDHFLSVRDALRTPAPLPFFGLVASTSIMGVLDCLFAAAGVSPQASAASPDASSAARPHGGRVIPYKRGLFRRVVEVDFQACFPRALLSLGRDGGVAHPGDLTSPSDASAVFAALIRGRHEACALVASKCKFVANASIGVFNRPGSNWYSPGLHADVIDVSRRALDALEAIAGTPETGMLIGGTVDSAFFELSPTATTTTIRGAVSSVLERHGLQHMQVGVTYFDYMLVRATNAYVAIDQSRQADGRWGAARFKGTLDVMCESEIVRNAVVCGLLNRVQGGPAFTREWAVEYLATALDVEDEELFPQTRPIVEAFTMRVDLSTNDARNLGLDARFVAAGVTERPTWGPGIVTLVATEPAGVSLATTPEAPIDINFYADRVMCYSTLVASDVAEIQPALPAVTRAVSVSPSTHDPVRFRPPPVTLESLLGVRVSVSHSK